MSKPISDVRLAAIRAVPSCTNNLTVIELLDEIDRLKEEIEDFKMTVEYAPWDTLVRVARRMIREHYPPDIFTAESRDAGPSLIVMLSAILDRIDRIQKKGTDE